MSKKYPSIQDIYKRCYHSDRQKFICDFLSDPGAFLIPECRNGFVIEDDTSSSNTGKSEGRKYDDAR